LQYTWRAVCILCGREGVRGMKTGNGGSTDLAVLVRLADVEKRASAALVLLAAHDGVHRT